MITPSDESADRSRAGDPVPATQRAIGPFWRPTICSRGHRGEAYSSLPVGPAACALRHPVTGEPCRAAVAEVL